MTPEERWSLFAAAALQGLLSNSSDGFPREGINWARRAAELADELSAEHANRGKNRRPPPPVRELPHWGSTGETVPRHLNRMPIQDTRDAAGRALEALRARQPTAAPDAAEEPPSRSDSAPSSPPQETPRQP